MSSFFGKLRGNNSSGGTSSEKATKRDSLALHLTPLTKLLQSAGPLRDDGSDKFFGLENFGNTCYCNSILQCLFYSVPFREQVIQYPVRSSPEMLRSKVSSIPTRLNANNGTIGPATVTLLPRLAGPGSPGIRPEDKPDTPEYKKKHAMLAGPVVMMDYEHANTYGMSESLFTSLKDLFEAIVANPSRHGVVAPHRFLENLKIKDEMFRTSMHQDAHEFLNLLLNDVVTNVAENTRKTKESHPNGLIPTLPPSLGHVLSTANGKPNGALVSSSPPRSWVHELFEGTLTSETKCLTCENVSQRDEAFLDLSVDLEEHSSVTRCMKKFSEEEMLCERNKFHCDNCGGLQEAEKRMKIKRLPRILALHLKRFKYIEDQQRFQKLFHRVRYPYHLRMSNTTDDAADPDRLYELYAVVVHIGGGPYHGHYVAIVKTEDRGWLLFDDELVEPVEKSYVQNFFGDKPGLACAYVLFYQATTEEAVRREQEAEGQAPTLTPLGTAEHPMHIGANGHGHGKLMEGGLHHLTTDTNAPLLAKEESPNLTQVITTPSPFHPALPMSDSPLTHSHTVSYPLSPRADAPSKKERAEIQRRQRQAGKDADRVEKARFKSTELRHREEEKQRQAEVKASTVSVAPIVTRIPPPPTPPQGVQAGDPPDVSSAEHSPASHRLSAVDDNPTASPLSGGGLGGSLSRLRRSSKSLSRKSIFGSNSSSSGTNHTRIHHDVPSPIPHRNTDVFGGGSSDSGPSTPEKRKSAANGGSSIPSSGGRTTKHYLPPSQHAHQQPTNKPLPPNPPVESPQGIPDKAERSRGVSLGHRFSLRRKTSGLFGLGS